MDVRSRQFPEAAPSDLANIRKFIETSALEMGASADEAGELVMAVHEAAENIITYGYKDRPGWLAITMFLNGNQLTVRLQDQAPSFDPTSAPPFDLSVPLDDRPRGGMGIHMMRSFTDEQHYARLPEESNQLTLIKKLGTGAAAGGQ